MGPNPTPSEVEEGYSIQQGVAGGERKEEGLGCRDGTVTLPTWGISAEVTTGKTASGQCLFYFVDALLFSFTFSQCYLVLLKQAVNSVIWVFSVPHTPLFFFDIHLMTFLFNIWQAFSS